MLNIGSAKASLCSGLTAELHAVGTASLAGLTLPSLFGFQKAGAIDASRPRSRIASRSFLAARANSIPGHEANAPEDVRGPSSDPDERSSARRFASTSR